MIRVEKKTSILFNNESLSGRSVAYGSQAKSCIISRVGIAELVSDVTNLISIWSRTSLFKILETLQFHCVG